MCWQRTINIYLCADQKTHGDSLCLIFFLLGLQGELDEQLLQLLIAVVDAELLKAVHRSRMSKRKWN